MQVPFYFTGIKPKKEKKMIFETHAHYDDSRFDDDREEVLAAVRESGVCPVINVGSSVASTRTTVELARNHDFMYAAVGVHPSEIGELNEESFAWLREQTAFEKTVAVGEIGLDYYWDKEPGVQERQRYWFGRQLELARETSLPVIIHSRDAASDTMQVMKEHHAEEIPGVVHCYSYSRELAEEFVKMGYYIGVGGVVTFKNAKKLVETVQAIPMERILLETDCPYMAPEPHRGTRNDSRNIPYVIARIAEIKGISAQEVERAAEENANRVFSRIPQLRQIKGENEQHVNKNQF
jgi:TatD DNase family protein